MDLPTGNERYFPARFDTFDTARLLANAARARVQTGLDGVFIVDADAHLYENESLKEILGYLSNPVLKQLAQSGQQVGRGRVLGSTQVGFEDLGGRITRYPLRGLEKTPGDGAPRDVHLALRWMDALGARFACLGPSVMLGLGLHPQPEVEADLSRAYNIWMTERVLPAAPRLRALIFVPMNDHHAALRTVAEFGARPGVAGFLITTARTLQIHDNKYMKLYAAIEERGLPIAFHTGPNWDDPMFKSSNRYIAAHALAFPWHHAIHCTNWIVNGMPERFPQLKAIWMEGGVGWAAWLGQRLDNEYKMRSSECPALRKLPSAYLREMYFTTHPFDLSSEAGLDQAIFDYLDGANSFLYASGYPQWDMETPARIWKLPFLGETAKRNILGGTAARLFGIDSAAA